MLERTAHAKVNLALHVTGQHSNGYHLLDTMVVFTEFGDVISVKDASGASDLVTFTIDGPFAIGLDTDADNLVSRAALALGNQLAVRGTKPRPVEIKLTKNLPVASGIGGGSADAAATLLALQEFWESDLDLFGLAADLGADVSMCLHSKPLRAQGIGNEIALLEGKLPIHLVLVNPQVEVSTPEVFKGLSEVKNPPISAQELSEFPKNSEIATMRNDLQNPAIEIESNIQQTLGALKNTHAQIVRMSGSGATCFGIYANQQQAREAGEQIQVQYPHWWSVATKTTVS